MTYELYIERETPITLDDWVIAVQSTKGVQINDQDVVGINPKTGSNIRIVASKGDADVYFAQTKTWKKVYTYGHSISFQKPHHWNNAGNETRIATFQLAKLLNAHVVNESGEIIDLKPAPKKINKPVRKTNNKTLTTFLNSVKKLCLQLCGLFNKRFKTAKSTASFSKKFSLDIVVKCNSFSTAYELWEALAPLHETVLSKPIYNELTGNDIRGENFVGAVKRNNRNDFFFRCGEGEIHYNNSGNRNGHVGHIRVLDLATSAKEAESWLTALLQDDRFVQARLIDWDYECWQNKTDIGAFERSGRDHSHLPKASNNLPFPLEKTIIDINNNPGRRVLNTNYLGAVGSTMWLGKDFWSLTGTDKDRVLNSREFDITEQGQSLRIKTQDALFTQSDGNEAERQNALRGLLFDCSSVT